MGGWCLWTRVEAGAAPTRCGVFDARSVSPRLPVVSPVSSMLPFVSTFPRSLCPRPSFDAYYLFLTPCRVHFACAGVCTSLTVTGDPQTLKANAWRLNAVSIRPALCTTAPHCIVAQQCALHRAWVLAWVLPPRDWDRQWTRLLTSA